MKIQKSLALLEAFSWDSLCDFTDIRDDHGVREQSQR